MHKTALLLALLLFAALLPTTSRADIRPLVPLYVLKKAGGAHGISDYFYTTSQSERSAAVATHGYDYAGILGYVSCSNQALRYDPNFPPTYMNSGYAVAPGPEYNYACPEAVGVPWVRYWHGPYSDHFYTSDSAERSYVQANGWGYEGVEAFLYPAGTANTVALYRLSRWDAGTQDLVHYFTTDWSEAENLWAYSGWQIDGLAGYLYPTYHDAAFAEAAIPTSVTVSKDYGSGRTDSHPFVRTRTARPGNAITQKLSMVFQSSDFFSQGGGNHVFIGLNAHLPIGADGLPAPPFEGLGVILTPGGFSCNGGNIQVEAVMTGTAGAFYLGHQPNGQLTTAKPNATFPSTCKSTPLFVNGGRYKLDLAVSIYGEVKFDVYEAVTVPGQGEVFQLRHSLASTAYTYLFVGHAGPYAGCTAAELCTGVLRPYAYWDARKTGAIILPVGGDVGSYSLSITDLSVTWQ